MRTEVQLMLHAELITCISSEKEANFAVLLLLESGSHLE